MHIHVLAEKSCFLNDLGEVNVWATLKSLLGGDLSKCHCKESGKKNGILSFQVSVIEHDIPLL